MGNFVFIKSMRNTAHKTCKNIKWHFSKYKILSAAICVGLRLYSIYIFMNEYPMIDVFTLDFNNMTPAYLKKIIKQKQLLSKQKLCNLQKNM